MALCARPQLYECRFELGRCFAGAAVYYACALLLALGAACWAGGATSVLDARRTKPPRLPAASAARVLSAPTAPPLVHEPLAPIVIAAVPADEHASTPTAAEPEEKAPPTVVYSNNHPINQGESIYTTSSI